MTDPLETEAVALPRVEVVRGRPDDLDIAALAAVIPAAYRQEADEATTAEPAHAAWTRSRRLRRSPALGARWGRFSG
ncbi:acyl-CoA carboxylase epsilon subunit [Microbacterium sp. Marseille-Q6965]|uniref:acyl-CoA carboxylase epsilon subunit n=1 Tax=Microbacterium sp. Marseille-Q6965 TaxID=2965072 RepID=UPI0021B7F1E6|nr:acyl-CoA carboxylase epsilon subunit [Microbacterium sp. Marseille-Q6965]